jgi:hypothetical protein
MERGVEKRNSGWPATFEAKPGYGEDLTICSKVPSDRMVTPAMASRIAETYINTFLLVLEVGSLRIDPDRTVEVPEGWYFYYRACRVDITPLQAETLEGAWPVFVSRVDGSVCRKFHPHKADWRT